MSTVLFDEKVLIGHLLITDTSVAYTRQKGMQSETDSVLRSQITGVDVKHGVNLFGWHGASRIRIHRAGGKDLVIKSIGYKTGERVLRILQ